ncbi:hypothetical protein PsorP6_017967 [Peronosclerospora sorghi]|uniref:Uncharacterized protein n=1 Tax=Peronosclerospora sorghi TaxID=230839 RepID=A0ACC0WFD1_9STRA|nr:hypothetical protein PsorP6_017967 [Peronosclerospora sorghi]
MTYKQAYLKARKESEQTGFGVKDHHRRRSIFTYAALPENMCPLYERMNNIFGKKPDAAPLAIFDSTAAEGDLGATLSDSPDEANADEDESDHPITDWVVMSRAAASSDNNNGERATTPEDGERKTALYDGEEGIVAPNARITAENTRTLSSASTSTTASATGTQKRVRDSEPKSLRATWAFTTSPASQWGAIIEKAKAQCQERERERHKTDEDVEQKRLVLEEKKFDAKLRLLEKYGPEHFAAVKDIIEHLLYVGNIWFGTAYNLCLSHEKQIIIMNMPSGERDRMNSLHALQTMDIRSFGEAFSMAKFIFSIQANFIRSS